MAVTLAIFGMVAVRRRPGWAQAVAALAMGVGWAVVAYADSWRMVIWPRSMMERMVLPTLVLAVVAGFGARWWVSFGGVWFAAWWLAGDGAVGEAFWRILFGGLFATWMLVRVGGRQPGRMVASGLVLAGAALVIGADAWVGAGLVLAAVSLAMVLGGRGSTLQVGLGMIAIVGAEVGAGRLLRGGLGVMDLACLGAIGAPGLVPLVERRTRRLGVRAAGLIAPVIVAGCLIGMAVLLVRLH